MARVIPMCEVCRRVFDDTQQVSGKAWIEVHRYLSRFVLPASAVEFSSAYCGDCQHSYRLLTTYGRDR